MTTRTRKTSQTAKAEDKPEAQAAKSEDETQASQDPTEAAQGDDVTPEPDGDSAAKDTGTEPKAATQDEQAGAKSGAKGKREVLRVTAHADSFRRAGIGFGRRETVLDVDALTDDQVEALANEPRLTVIRDQVDEEAE